jgi:DnaJ-class molecular chaperone
MLTAFVERLLSRWIRCPDCHGAGTIIVDWNSLMKCYRCDGTGLVER